MKAPCVRCGEMLLVNEAGEPIRVTIALSSDDLEACAVNAPSRALRTRFLCALGLIDLDRERRVRDELVAAELL